LRRWHEEVQSIANTLSENFEDQILRNNFIELILQLVTEQPLKTPFVAAVVLSINTQKPQIVEEILARAATATEANIEEGQWRDVKLYLKFLACLQSCLAGDGVFPVLEELFSRAVDLQTASSDDVCLTIAPPSHLR
jgi:nuclear cap-binding protein subunit 1